MSGGMRFTVYVDGDEMARAVTARLRELCRMQGVAAQIAVVDVSREPLAAEESNVIGVPTVVREQPTPRRRVIGALDDTRRVTEALGIDTMSSLDAEGAQS